MKESIIIPYHKDKEMISYNVSILVSTVPQDVEIIIIGNNYNENELDISFPYDNVFYYKVNENLYYPKAINLGVSKSSGDIITMYDPDVFALPHWYEPLREYISYTQVGAVSSKLINPCTGRIIDFGMYHSRFNAIHSLIEAKSNHPLAQYNRKVQSACSAVLMTKRTLFDSVGGMNNDLPYAYTDIDYCLKLKEKGYETWVIANSEVYHKGFSDKNNSKSYSFHYLNADSKGLFYASNYGRFEIDFEKWFWKSWEHFRKSFPEYPLEYFMLDFSTVYNREDYYTVLKKMGITIMDRQVISLTQRDIPNIHLHQCVPFRLIDLTTPILYFVDLFTSLQNNHLWFTHRDTSHDLIIDRHGNIYAMNQLIKNEC